MMEAWRLTKSIHADTAFDGGGARRVGGRFNSPGLAVVYCADSLALALLEMTVHVPTYKALEGLIYFKISFSENMVETISLRQLPKNWRTTPAPRSTKILGDEWLRSGRSVILQIPSVVLPESSNFLLNPLHPRFVEIQVSEPKPVVIDPRLIK